MKKLCFFLFLPFAFAVNSKAQVKTTNKAQKIICFKDKATLLDTIEVIDYKNPVLDSTQTTTSYTIFIHNPAFLPTIKPCKLETSIIILQKLAITDR